MLDKINNIINENESDFKYLNEYIYQNPELGYEEYLSSQAHCDLLSKNNFIIEKPYLGIETAFRAVYDSGKSGPTIAFMAEYDALPGIGHACGHNMLGTTSSSAGIVLSKIIDSIGGKVVVLGTPAEETSGAKVTLSEKGAFNDIDITMIVHPAEEYYESGQSLALEAIEFTFLGKSAHAGSSPEKGINALNSVINMFNSVNIMRGHIQSDARIHGIITEGGIAANIVPERAVARFYIRANTKQYLKELSVMIRTIAKNSAESTGAKVEIINYELSYDNLITNQVLNDLFINNLKISGVDKILSPKKTYGSIDAGNVSHFCPLIHPYFKISEKPIVAHTREFAMETLTDYAYKNMKATVSALVMTSIELIENPNVLNKVKEEFEKSIKRETE